MTALIVTQGPAGRRQALRRLAVQADLIIAADGGARVVRTAGVRPHLILGDFDSLDPATARWITRRRIPVRRFSVIKDATDAELALIEASRRGARDVWIFGAMTGRLDQALATLFLLLRAHAPRTRVRLTDGRAVAWVVRRAARIDGRPGDLVSLLPLTPRVQGIVAQGLRYPLREGTLRRGSTRGVSNEIVTPPASVRLTRGELLLIHTPRRISA